MPAMIVDLGPRPVPRLAGRLVRVAAGCTPSSLLVLVLSGIHGFLSARPSSDFAEDRNTRPARFYRIINEVPTVLMIVIVILVIVKPF